MNIRQFLRIVEIRTKIVSLSALLIGTLAAWCFDRAFDLADCLLLWLAALAVDMGTTAFNSFFDYYNRVDNSRFNLERDKVLVHEGVAPGLALLVALGLFALAAALGLALSIRAGWELAAVGALGMAVGFFYNGGPLPLSRTPLGELFAGGFLGYLLPLVVYWVFARQLDTRIALVALPSFLLVASILTVNNTCDAVGDKEAGRLTLSILIGPAASRVLVPAEGAAAWLAMAALPILGVLPAWSGAVFGLAALAALPQYRAMARRGYSHATKGPNMGSVSLVFNIYSAAMALSLLLAIAIR